jgi:hypothetical protein
MGTYVYPLNFGKKGTLLEVLKKDLGGRKKREISVNLESLPRRRPEYLGRGLPKRCKCP